MFVCVIDPILSLAVSMQSNKGVYALLIGSGVSRSSGIPTGWEIVQDLIKRLAALREEPCGPDPDTWFRNTFNFEPEYSELLDNLAKTPAERQQLLRAYFEPTEEEREQGLKKPSQAHRAIADLVSKGYIRVIVTTNFDRLLEQALVDDGIQPSIVSTADGAKGALPLVHSPCTIVKVNGDYLDTRIKNTRGELEEYEKPTNDLLDRIFDEYGLIVCGWSAEWDTALRGAIERCSGHRFTTYWTARSEMTGKALDVLNLRRGVMVAIKNADQFFTGLSEKVITLEHISAIHPLSAQVAVAQVKKFLASPQYDINLHDLIASETERVYAIAHGEGFTLMIPPSELTLAGRVSAYDELTTVLVAAGACTAYWSEPRHFETLIGAFRRLFKPPTQANGLSQWLELRAYPAVRLLYAMGVAATASEKYTFLRALLSAMVQPDRYKPSIEVAVAYGEWNLRMIQSGWDKSFPVSQQSATPFNFYLDRSLRHALRDYLPDDDAYQRAFDWFEYLVALVYCDFKNPPQKIERVQSSGQAFEPWGPLGCFWWRRNSDLTHIADETALSAAGVPRKVAAVRTAGIFGGAPFERFQEIKDGFDRFIEKCRQGRGMYF